MDDALRLALLIERSFDPGVMAIAAGCLFPNSPAATEALYESVVNHTRELADVARTTSTDPQVQEEASSLEKRVEASRLLKTPVSK